MVKDAPRGRYSKPSHWILKFVAGGRGIRLGMD